MSDIKSKLGEPLWERWYFGERISGGGSGEVYQLIDKQTGEITVVKIITVDIASENGNKENKLFTVKKKLQYAQTEIETMYALRNEPNIVHCLNCDIRQMFDRSHVMTGFHYLIQMECLTSLASVCDDQCLTEEQTVKLGLQISHALEAIHNRGIVHRDIKPDNIFINSNGNFLLGDFGAANMLQTDGNTTAIGTEPYMAPEVYRAEHNEKYGRTVDIYSLGLVMYAMINSNYLPFQLENGKCTHNIAEATSRRLKDIEEIPRLPLDMPLADITFKCCRKDSRERYQSAAELISDLERSYPLISKGIKKISAKPTNAYSHDMVIYPQSTDNPALLPHDLGENNSQRDAQSTLRSIPLIKAVTSIGANPPLNFKSSGFFTSSINMNHYSHILFYVHLLDEVGYNTTMNFSFMIQDTRGNTIINESSEVSFEPGNSTVRQYICINGDGGTMVSAGNYTAYFRLNDSQVFPYNFEINTDLDLFDAPASSTDVRPRKIDYEKRSKKVIMAEKIYLLVAVLFFFVGMIPVQFWEKSLQWSVAYSEFFMETTAYGIYNCLTATALTVLYVLPNIKGYSNYLRSYVINALFGLLILLLEMVTASGIKYLPIAVSEDVSKAITAMFCGLVFAFLATLLIGILVGIIVSLFFKLIIKLVRIIKYYLTT